MNSQITRQNTNENQSMVYQAFLVFYNNTQYQRRSAVLKKKILEGDLHTISIVIKVIKSILTYKTPITIERLIEKETAKEFQQIAKRYKNLLYNEFSKLLTLRFLREVYFQFSYAFMTCAHLQLNVILLKIAMFRHQSSDQERGKQMFYKQSKLFDCFQGCKQEKQPQHSKQIQTIGFSIHKMTLQILHTCGKLSKYLPYHQSFIEEEQEQIKQDKFQNAFYNTFIKVRQSAVKFPSKFHYFKESDLSKFRNIYDKNRKKDQSFRKLYTQIFSELWNLINHKIDNLKQQNVGLSQFLLMNNQQYGNLQQKIMYCQNLVLKTYDRYFWTFFHDFIGNKLNQLKNTLQFSESLTQTQLKYILSIFYFFIIWSHKLMQPQILYVIQHQYFHQLCKFFLIVLKFYARWSDQKQKKALKLLKKSKTPSRPFQSKLTSLQVLLEMKSCFRYIRQLGIDFSHHFTQKKNLAHSYPLISQLSDQILTIKFTDQQGKINPDNESKLNSQISKRMSINHQYFFNKQEFIFLYHEKKAHNNYNFKQIKESLIKQAQSIFQKYKNHLKLGNYQPIQPLTQYVTLDKQQEQLTIPQEDTLSTKIASIKRLSYKLNISHHRSYSEDKSKIYEKLPPLKSSLRNSNTSEPSFIDSLKIGVNKPNEDLLKIITSSRGLKRGGSSLQNSSVKSQMSHQNSEISHAVSISISDKDCSKTNLVSSFQQLKSFREVCLQDTNHIPSQKLAERFINPIKRNFKKSSRGTTPSKQANYNYITNHNESNIKELEISSEDQSNRKSYIEELKSQLKVTSNSKFVNNTLTTDLFPVKISEDLLIRDNNRNSDKDDVSLKVSRQHSSRITIKQSDSQSLLHFLYTPKAKRELLKKKTLVKKTQYIEVGLITNLQQQIIANQKETVKKETLCIKVYITALVPLSKVLVNIKFPNWLQCLSKGNLSKEDMNQQSQFISTFLVQLKLKKQKIAKRNYGQLPTLNIVYYDRHQKKDIISEPLFILINKFAIQKSSNQNEISQSFRLNLQSFIQIELHDKIASDIKGLKSYFANITFMHLDPEEMMSSFASIDNLKDEIAVVKYQFIRPNQEIFLIFAEKQQRITFKLNHQKRKLSAWIVPKKSQAWNYQQLHIFQNCFRSILTAN